MKDVIVILIVLAIAGLVYWAKRGPAGRSGAAGRRGRRDSKHDAVDSGPVADVDPGYATEPWSPAPQSQSSANDSGWGGPVPWADAGQTGAGGVPSGPAYGSQVDVAVRDTAGNVLLVQGPQGWGLVSGHVTSDSTVLDAASRILAEATGWPVPAGDQLDAVVIDDTGMVALVQVRLAVAGPDVTGGAWGTVQQAANALPGDQRLAQLT